MYIVLSFLTVCRDLMNMCVFSRHHPSVWEFVPWGQLWALLPDLYCQMQMWLKDQSRQNHQQNICLQSTLFMKAKSKNSPFCFSGGPMCNNPKRGWDLSIFRFRSPPAYVFWYFTFWLFLFQKSSSSLVRGAATRNAPVADTSVASCVVWWVFSDSASVVYRFYIAQTPGIEQIDVRSGKRAETMLVL